MRPCFIIVDFLIHFKTIQILTIRVGQELAKN